MLEINQVNILDILFFNSECLKILCEFKIKRTILLLGLSVLREVQQIFLGFFRKQEQCLIVCFYNIYLFNTLKCSF